VASTALPPNVPPPRRSFAGALLLLVLLAGAVAAAAGYGWRHWQAQQRAAAAQADARQQALDARIERLLRAQQAQAQRLQQAEATNRLLREELLGLGQRAGLLEDSLSRLADPDRNAGQALRLDGIELLLDIGQQRLQLADDLDGARRALALAAPLLAGIDDPAYLNLRQVLLQEQAAMEALGADPRIRASALLARIEPALDAEPIDASADAGRAPWYRRLLARVVQAQTTAGSGLRHAADREAARAALQVELSLARAALERRDTAAFRTAVQRIDAGLQRLLAGSPALDAHRRTLAELRVLPLHVHAPLAGSTLQQLRALRTR
jgi:uroporphyrin-3 C-methyltransferase